MHGLGNDYVYINGLDADNAAALADPATLAKRVSDRHFGIGGDGLILLLPPQEGIEADCRMRMFNADGSESEMCGNGIRCVCKLAHDSGVTTANPMRIQTEAGILSLSYTLGADGKVDQVTVDMGAPILDLPAIPVLPAKLKPHQEDEHSYLLPVSDRWQPKIVDQVAATFVSMGNPHAVIFWPVVRGIDLQTVGPQLENYEAFPKRMNIHFVEVVSRTEVRVIHWERGSGPTLACGTGACAVCVAGVLTGRTDRRITAHLPGGTLDLQWRQDTGHVMMQGPAVTVFTGEYLLS